MRYIASGIVLIEKYLMEKELTFGYAYACVWHTQTGADVLRPIRTHCHHHSTKYTLPEWEEKETEKKSEMENLWQ